jgi:hypothetical protein
MTVRKEAAPSLDAIDSRFSRGPLAPASFSPHTYRIEPRLLSDRLGDPACRRDQEIVAEERSSGL